MTIVFEYELDQLVRVLGTGCVGKVVGLWVGESGLQKCAVRRFHEGKMYEDYHREDELAVSVPTE